MQGSAPVEAPDFVEPIVGWRLWHVVESGGKPRLRSPLYRNAWLPGEELVATCRRGAEAGGVAGRPGRRPHTTPGVRCRCGIYASHTARQTVIYLSRFFRQREDVLHRVVGLASLWGTVVECEWGWRASRAYPARIYVPTPKRAWLPGVTGLRRPALSVEEIAFSLTDYGVPVEIVDCVTHRDLAETLDGEETRPPGPLARALD